MTRFFSDLGHDDLAPPFGKDEGGSKLCTLLSRHGWEDSDVMLNGSTDHTLETGYTSVDLSGQRQEMAELDSQGYMTGNVNDRLRNRSILLGLSNPRVVSGFT